MKRDEALRLAKAHGLTDDAIRSLTPTDSYGGLSALQQQGVQALLTLYDANAKEFADWVADEKCGEAIESLRSLL